MIRSDQGNERMLGKVAKYAVYTAFLLKRFFNTSSCPSATAVQVTSTGHLKWDHFDILAKGRPDILCIVKETLLIRDLKPTLNENVSSESSIFISF